MILMKLSSELDVDLNELKRWRSQLQQHFTSQNGSSELPEEDVKLFHVVRFFIYERKKTIENVRFELSSGILKALIRNNRPDVLINTLKARY